MNVNQAGAYMGAGQQAVFPEVTHQFQSQVHPEPMATDTSPAELEVKGPKLVITEQPLQRGYRFRYETEKGKHGSLEAEGSDPKEKLKKKYPTVQIVNYDGPCPVIVTATLVTEEKCRTHVHTFVCPKDGKNGSQKLPTMNENGTATANTDSTHVAKFDNLVINHVPKKCFWDRAVTILRQEHGREPTEDEVKEMVERIKNYKMNVVKIKFECVVGEIHLVAISEPIYDQKSAETAKLKICAISHCSCPTIGGKTMILLCEKIQKDGVRVRFGDREYSGGEEDGSWYADGMFGQNDVHKQVAIVLKVPPFRDRDIQESAVTYLQLVRTSDGSQFSDALHFSFIPCDRDPDEIERKRKKRIPGVDVKDDQSQPVPFTNPNEQAGTSNQRFARSPPQMSLHGASYVPEARPVPVHSVGFGPQPMSVDQNYYLPPQPAYGYQFLTPSSTIQTDSECVQLDKEEMTDRFHVMSLPMKDNQPDNRPCLSESKQYGRRDAGLLDTTRVSDNPGYVDPMEISAETAPMKKECIVSKNANEQNTTIPPQGHGNVTRAVTDTQPPQRRNYGVSVVTLQKLLACFQTYYSKTGDSRFLLMSQRWVTAVPNDEEDGDNPLHTAVLHQNVDVVSNYLDVIRTMSETDRAFIINAHNNLYQTPLHLAVTISNNAIIKLLLNCGAQTTVEDYCGNTCYHQSVMRANVDTLHLLLSHIPDTDMLDKKNYAGYTALHLAVMERRNVTMVELLVDAGADVDHEDGLRGMTPLHHAIEADREDIVRYLVKQCDVNYQNWSRNTALHIAVGHNRIHIVKILMEHGAVPEIRNVGGSAIEDFPEVELPVNAYESMSSGLTAYDLTDNEEMIAVLNEEHTEENYSLPSVVEEADGSPEGAVGGKDEQNLEQAIVQPMKTDSADNPPDSGFIDSLQHSADPNHSMGK